MDFGPDTLLWITQLAGQVVVAGAELVLLFVGLVTVRRADPMAGNLVAAGAAGLLGVRLLSFAAHWLMGMRLDDTDSYMRNIAIVGLLTSLAVGGAMVAIAAGVIKLAQAKLAKTP